MAHVVQALTPPPSRRATSDPFGSSPFSPSGGNESSSSRRRPRPQTEQQQPPAPAAVRVSMEGPAAAAAADLHHQMALMAAASALLAPPSLDHEPSPLPPTTFLDDDDGRGMPSSGEWHRSASVELEAMVLDRVSRMAIDEPSQPQPQPQPATTTTSGSIGSGRPGHRRGSPSPIPSTSSGGGAQHSTIATAPSDFSSFVLDQAASAALQPSASRPAYAAHAVEKSSPVPSADYTSPASSAGSLDDMFGLANVGIPAVGDEEGEVHPLRRTDSAVQNDQQTTTATSFAVASAASAANERQQRQQQQQQQPQQPGQRQRPAPRRFRVLSHPPSSATASRSSNDSTAPKIIRPPLRIRREKRSMSSDRVAGCDDLTTPVACNRGSGGDGGGDGNGGNGREQQQYIGEGRQSNCSGSRSASVLLPRLSPPLRTIHVPSSADAATDTAAARNTLCMDGAALNIDSTSGGGAGTGGRKRRMLRKHRRTNASIGGGTGGGSGTGDNIFGGLLPNLADIFGGGGGGNAATTATVAKTQPSLPTGVAGNTLSRTRNGMASSSICCPFPDPFGLLTSKSQQLSPKPTTTGGSTAAGTNTNKSPLRPTTTTIPRPRPSAPTPREQQSSLSPRTPHHSNAHQGSSVGGGANQVVANAFDRRLDLLASGIKTKTKGISASQQRREPPTPSLVPKFRSSPLPFSANITPQPRRASKYGKQRRSTSGGGGGGGAGTATSSSRGSAAGKTSRNGRRVRGGARSSTSSTAAFSPAPAQPSSHAPTQPQQPQFGYAAPPPPHPSAIEAKMSFDVHEENDDGEGERTGTAADADDRSAVASVLPVMPMLSAPEEMDSAAAGAD